VLPSATLCHKQAEKGREWGGAGHRQAAISEA